MFHHEIGEYDVRHKLLELRQAVLHTRCRLDLISVLFKEDPLSAEKIGIVIYYKYLRHNSPPNPINSYCLRSV